jgi:hypothetical protein
MFGMEIEDGFIMHHIDNIEKTKKLAIHSWDNKFLMRITLERDGDVRICSRRGCGPYDRV